MIGQTEDSQCACGVHQNAAPYEVPPGGRRKGEDRARGRRYGQTQLSARRWRISFCNSLIRVGAVSRHTLDSLNASNDSLKLKNKLMANALQRPISISPLQNLRCRNDRASLASSLGLGTSL